MALIKLESFQIIKPEHAMLHIRVIDENDKEIGQRFLVVHKMQAGYRHIILRNIANQSEGPASVFVKIDLNISYPAVQKQMREQIESPLRNLEAQQEERDNFANPMKSSGKRKDKRTNSPIYNSQF